MTIIQIRSNDGTGALSYLVADEEKNIAAIIDPNIEDMQNILYCSAEKNVKIKYIIDTHTHADHVSGADELKKYFDAETYMHAFTKNKMKILENAAKFGIEETLKTNAKIKVDHYLNDGDVIKIGSLSLKIIYTPGHTENHITLSADNALFTGDLLLIGQAGRTDLPGGNPEKQYHSLFDKIMKFPPATKIYPGHDYEGKEFSYLKEELKNNPFLQQRSKEEYVKFVNDFFPPFAENAAEGGKMTLQCGVKRIVLEQNEVREITASDLRNMLHGKKDIFLLDVREPFELRRYGAIDGVINVPVGQLPKRISELPQDKSKEIVCICTTGNRSYEAAHYLMKKGYFNVMNLEGGTYAWLTEAKQQTL